MALTYPSNGSETRLVANTCDKTNGSNTFVEWTFENPKTVPHSSNGNDPTFHVSSGNSTTGTDQCNESLKHSNAQKAVFHSVKGAKRMADENQEAAAARIAGEAGKAFLQAEDKSYDSDRSASYLDNLLDADAVVPKNIAAGIERAWEKIDSGQHVGGARIAVSVADRYVDGYSLPRTTE